MRTPKDYGQKALTLTQLARAGRNRHLWAKAADYAERRRVAATDAVIEELIGE